ncbi:MAG: hypothetical protein JRF40_01175 [Deltaproteobacteria bacterium]|nr:hypothetical protein [Deltaproteobacteria bacterium]
MKKNIVSIILLMFLFGAAKGLSPESKTKIGSAAPQRLHVECLCYHDWSDGRVKTEAVVKLREGTSFGPFLNDAAVRINDHALEFAEAKQIYTGAIGEIEQWQRIPILIQTSDGRKVDGYIAVVFLVQFIKPKPFASVPSSYVLPLRWDYSEGSMHTVELIILKDDIEMKALEIPGNSTALNFKRLGLPISKGDLVRILVLPPWTNNFELHGNLTKSSKAHFITRASLSIQF